MVKKVLMIIANKSEAAEIVVPVDVLRNTEGVQVTIASVHGNHPVTVSAGIVIIPDASIDDVNKHDFDAIVMPGGEGYINLEKSQIVGEILRTQYENGKLVAGICMSPNVFLAFKIGLGSRITSYPLKNEALKKNYEYLEEAVVQDKVSRKCFLKSSLNILVFLQNMITSRGPSTVYAFALKIVENLVGLEVAKERAKANLIFDLF